MRQQSFFSLTKCYLLFISIVMSGANYARADMETSKRLTAIQQSGVLRVCIWPNYYAITYRNPLTNKLEGIDIDMAHEFAHFLNVRLQFVDSSFSELSKNLSSDACDIAMHGVGVRESRKKVMDFSVPYLVSDIYAIAAKSNQSIASWNDIDRSGNVVSVLRGTFMEPVMRDYLQQANLLVVDSFHAREQEVLSGRADVFMTDYPYGKRVEEAEGWGVMLAPEKPLAQTYYAYAIAKGQPNWLATVNQFVRQQQANGALQKLAKKYRLEKIVAK